MLSSCSNNSILQRATYRARIQSRTPLPEKTAQPRLRECLAQTACHMKILLQSFFEQLTSSINGNASFIYLMRIRLPTWRSAIRKFFTARTARYGLMRTFFRNRSCQRSDPKQHQCHPVQNYSLQQMMVYSTEFGLHLDQIRIPRGCKCRTADRAPMRAGSRSAVAIPPPTASVPSYPGLNAS